MSTNASIVELARGTKASDERQITPPVDYAEIGSAETPDFGSFLADIDAGAIDSVDELLARLSAVPGTLVAVQGIPLLDRGGGQIVENRTVTAEDAKLLLEEFSAKKALERASSTVKDFRSYLDDVLTGEISDQQELDGRIQSGNSANSVFVNGTEITEARRVTGTQVDILQTALSARESLSSRQARVRALFEVNERIASGQIDPVDSVMQLITREYPSLLRQPEQIEFLLNQESASKEQVQRLESLETTTDSICEVLDQQTGAASLGTKTGLSEETVEFIAQTISTNDVPLLSALREVLTEGQTEAVIQRTERSKNNSRTNGELKRAEAQTKVLLCTVTPELRRIFLEKTFTRDLAACLSLETVDATRARLSNVEAVSQDDEPLLAALEALADQREEEINTREAYRLGARNGTADAIDYTLAIQEPAGDNRYTTLLENLYQIEFANFALQAYELISDGASEAEFDQFLEQQSQRRPVANIDFTSEFAKIRSQIDTQAKYISDLDGVIESLALFGGRNFSAEQFTAQVEERFTAPEDVLIKDTLLQRAARFVALRKDRLADSFDFIFGGERDAVAERANGTNFNFEQNLGRNYQASRFLSAQYRKVIQPLFESLRGNGVLRSKLESYLFDDSAGGFNPFRIASERLAQQRTLTDIEASYFESVELLAHFNPQLVALAREVPDILSVYLESHFANLDKATFESLEDGSYVPMIQIGLGAQGVVAAGETARYVPNIAAETLYVDDGELPGGPFAVPKGPGWLLNSKTSAGSNEFSLPDVNEPSERMKVRAYGSPLRWYVGERNAGRDIRLGSINVSADFLPQTDEFAQRLYPDNEEEALALQLQAAMLTTKALFRTRFVGWEPVDDDGSGDKIAFFEKTHTDGEITRFSVRTDQIVVASGLGESTLGINPETASNREVLDRSAELVKAGLRPLLTDSLGAFQLQSSRELESPGTGKVWVVFGGGNSADTQVENLTGIFGRNRGGRELEKIYVINNGTFSSRDRYALIEDVTSKNGRPNIVERIDGRVSRVELVETVSGPRVRFYDGQSLIRGRNGNPVVADVGVAATGFRSNIGRVLADVDDVERFRSERYLQYLTLPTNTGVAVADRLVADPSIIIVGTASRTGYANDFGVDAAAKFLQLPRDARRALQDNGAENAVAIGIRGQDTQAAMRLFLEERFVRQADKDMLAADVGRFANPARRNEQKIKIPIQSEPEDFKENVPSIAPVRDDVEKFESVLESLVFLSFQDVRFTGVRKKKPLSRSFDISLSADASQVTITGIPEGLPREIFSNPFFVGYAKQAIKDRKGATKLVVNLAIVKGRVDPKESSILAA